jgi:pSer/pThr/pTyr-binding forkhead associated (FHA) protein
MDMATDTLTPPHSAQSHDTAALENPTFLRPDPFGLLDHRLATGAVSRAEAMPGHYLSIADSGGVEHLVGLEGAITHVGRAVASDVRFEDVHVSRRHAIIVRYGDHVRVLDDRSSAGTFVNGQRVIATDLLSGDVVRLGPILFAYVRVR